MCWQVSKEDGKVRAANVHLKAMRASEMCAVDSELHSGRKLPQPTRKARAAEIQSSRFLTTPHFLLHTFLYLFCLFVSFSPYIRAFTFT